MHILHLNQLYNPASGASRYFREIGARLVREGHRVTLLSTDALDLEYFWDARCRHVEPGVTEQDGMRIIRFPVQRMPGPSLAYQILRRLMVDLGRLGQPVAPLLMRLATVTPRLPTLEHFLATAPELADVTVLHTTNITLDFAVIPAARWARQRGIRHLCTPFVHLGEPGKRQIVQYYTMPHQIALLQACAAVATMTTLERDALIAYGVPAEQVHVVGAGIDLAEVAGGDGAAFRAHYQISGPLVLSLGAAAYDKGTIHVLEAMQRLWASGVEATWVQCGPLLAHFEHYCKRLPAEARARIHVLGYVSDATRRDALAAATVYAQPSRTDSFGISYLEAWAYGVPVVGALAGGVPAVIRDGLDGLLVPFGDSAALAEALKRLLNDPGYARQLGASGQARVMRELTWEAAYQRIRGLYEASLQR